MPVLSLSMFNDRDPNFTRATIENIRREYFEAGIRSFRKLIEGIADASSNETLSN